MVADTMRAAVVSVAGGPEVLKIESRRVPAPAPGQVLIQVKAFGLNRSDMFTRQGHSPVVFPRILGIKAVGLVADAPGKEFEPGETVATVMGGMGRQFDGSYAECVCVPAGQVMAVRTELGWARLGALPEMLQTAWGALTRALRLEPGERLLIRGGSTSVGLAAAAIAKRQGAFVASTTRRAERAMLLRRSGCDVVFVDDGAIAEAVVATFAGGVDKMLELVGTTTLRDSLRCARPDSVVCMAGIVGNSWTLADFTPMDDIPTAVNLTTYSGTADDFMQMPLQLLVDQVADGALPIPVGRTFPLEDIVKAHREMEANTANGKMVGLT